LLRSGAEPSSFITRSDADIFVEKCFTTGTVAKFAGGRAVAAGGEYSWVSKQGSSLEDLFKGRQFEGEIIILCVLQYNSRTETS
jgi:hypothetical protein